VAWLICVPCCLVLGASLAARALAVHPTLPYLACAGLDRTSRVFNLKTGKLAHTSYLKQRLSAVGPHTQNKTHKKTKRRRRGVVFTELRTKVLSRCAFCL
jgi:WD40 repeat protein